MNCEAAQQLLSAFYDQQLDAEAEAAVRRHLEGCGECTKRLVEFEELSTLAANLRAREVPAGTWSAIDSSRNSEGQHATHVASKPRLRRSARGAMAAALLAGVAASMAIYWNIATHDDHAEMAVFFDRYLHELEQNPEQAQDVLIERYDGQLVDLQGAAAALKFVPNAPEQLPYGFSRSSIYVLKMPCCTCTQTIYKNQDGAVLALFEHQDEEREWFGDRPTIMADCCGKDTCFVELPDQLAATWKCGPRYLTVVGIRDVEQAAEFVAFLNAQNQESEPS